MFLSVTSQLATKNLTLIVFYIIIVYTILSMVRQHQIVTFLGYKALFITYMGWWLVVQNLDILALILWIVYGSFIAVIFIFSFIWLPSQHPSRATDAQARYAYAAPTMLLIAAGLGINATVKSYNTFFTTT